MTKANKNKRNYIRKKIEEKRRGEVNDRREEGIYRKIGWLPLANVMLWTHKRPIKMSLLASL
jgi:hypothetical protein